MPVPRGTCTATSSTVTFTSSGALMRLPRSASVKAQTVAGGAGLCPAGAEARVAMSRQEEGGNVGETWFPPRERAEGERQSRRHRCGRVVRMRVARGDDSLDRARAPERAASLLDVRLELGAELAQVALHGIDREVAERAEGTTEDAVADVVEQVEVGVLAAALLDLLEQLHEPARPLAARRALAARLVHVELLRAQRELHHAAALVDH